MNNKNFHFLFGDVNFNEYGGKWYRQNSEEEYTIIELINMEDACNDTSNGKYLITITEIDLSLISNENKISALHCNGLSENETSERLILEALHSYGSGDQIDSFYTNNYKKGLSRAKMY